VSAARSARYDELLAAVARPALQEEASTRVSEGTPPEGETWPQGISHDATMRISDVLRSLRAEFPAVSHSKLRFLEEQGLVHPVRTPAGYRQYSPADVERLRFVLVEQRDRYLPLKVIKDKLSALDQGAASSDQPLIPRLATKDGESTTGSEGALTVEALASEAGVELSFVEELVTAGVLRPGQRGQLDPGARDVVVLAAGLGEHGIGPRHLRGLRAAADRQVALVEQVIAPVRAQQAPAARARAATTASELGEMCAQLHTAWLRQGIADLAT
jgi:DNA-binding transcriptional MerR regulator